ncbi:related to oxidoreductase [Ramularia collo-cygni]|uniref:Related to oxidoreductase n=1 Tax=Ramularia collo-cygni TaxID=112498 RepID=A0A2D3URD1_9PEZI|nr:related to oxidoreductase [Ramularia collo-cygni]CZT16055.1 related to oxidoreductase [Ramularia collo-cygni]
MSPSNNKAASLLHKQQKPFQISPAPLPVPTSTQILIKVHALAINPCDAGIQNLGIIWEEFPVVIGCDVAGIIVEIGSDVDDDDEQKKKFKVGDRVLACVEFGAFQEFCTADVQLISKIPENVGFEEAAVLPVAIVTAAVSLFEKENMGLEMPVLEPKVRGEVVLVWGASSSVGSCAVQLLRAAGYEVFATAGKANLQYCQDLGASRVLDYKNADVEGNIVEAIETSGLNFAGVFSAIIDLDVLKTCVKIADRFGLDKESRVVGTVIPPGMPMFPLPEVPEGLRLTFCKGPSGLLPNSVLRGIFGWEKQVMTDVGPRIFGDWMFGALESGLLKCKPDPFVVGKGLESVQEACDLMSQGVSARKLVVEL